jgi:SpoVK/Ycf46/Vps4 family AAA+-type ATPase
LDQLAALWIARLSIGTSIAMSQLNTSLFSDDLRRMIGIAPEDGPLHSGKLRGLLKCRTDELAADLAAKRSTLARNVDLLGDLLALNEVQREVLVFAAVWQQHAFLGDFLEGLRATSVEQLAALLATALKRPTPDVFQALRADSSLLATRVLTIEDAGRRVELAMSPSLQTALFAHADDLRALMAAFLETTPPPKLTEAAFPHLAAATALLLRYLRVGSAAERQGINVLLYGPPGTGKTEYVRWLAQQLKRPLYQVRATDDQGQPVCGQDRLASFVVSQQFLQKSDALILFDEVEEVFPSGNDILGLLFGARRPAPGKLFLNRILEDNPVPAIWVANEVSQIDAAYLRRFDLSFEISVPPASVRRSILTGYLHAARISEATVATLALHDQLSPSQVEKAAKVLRLANPAQGDREAVLAQVIDSSMKLLAQRKNPTALTTASHGYRLDYLNADHDLAQLVASLRQTTAPKGAMCFFGPPGTGKTALAHHLAQQIDRPLHARRASDILGPYVGQTEQRIAALFRNADADGAILLLDEADSFLQDRREAKASWEVTAVNEMLTQMESFAGLFICSTNLMDRLDEASLRRFAIKVRFDYLTLDQRCQLLLDHLPKQSRAQRSQLRQALAALANLTPGDFATIRRQSALFGTALDADAWLDRLRRESQAKRDQGRRRIGFM